MNMMKMDRIGLNVQAAREHALTHDRGPNPTLESREGEMCVYCVQIHIWLGEQADELRNSIMDLQRRIDALIRDSESDVEDLGRNLGVLTVTEVTL